MRKYLLFLLLLLGCSSSQQADNFVAMVIGVKDGDTIEVLRDKKTYTIRLADVDCPEKSQAFGSAAKKFTADFCFGKEVKIISNGKVDRYKRFIATVTVNEVSLNKQLVINGLAWHYKKYSTNNEFTEMEEKARQNKIGLWADESPTPPWDFRKNKKKH